MKTTKHSTIIEEALKHSPEYKTLDSMREIRLANEFYEAIKREPLHELECMVDNLTPHNSLQISCYVHSSNWKAKNAAARRALREKRESLQ